jgi:N-terminal domain on NACHT_NTPase and P-loop NTPases
MKKRGHVGASQRLFRSSAGLLPFYPPQRRQCIPSTMSGIEALAVIGIIANIIALVDFSVKVYDRAKGFGDEVKDVPEEFREVRRILPLVANTLEKTSSHAKSGQVDEETCKVLRPVLEGCQIKIEELSAIFNNVLPAEGASKWTRGWKAVSSMGQDKKVKALASKIWDDVQALTYYHVSEGATAAQLTNLTTAMATFTASVSSKKTQFMLRYQKDEDFIGRDEVMKEIEERSKTMKRVAIAGIGGVGYGRQLLRLCSY